MLFSVEQTGLFSAGLVWEYGRVLGRSRRKTLTGKLIFFPGVWFLFMGITFSVGLAASIREPLTEEEGLGMLAMVPVTLALLLGGISWCGICRLPAALVRLLGQRRARESSRFYAHHITRFKDCAYIDYPYRAVLDVYEGKRAFFLRMEGEEVLVLPKSRFVQGETGAFRRFMDEKCGKPVIRV